MRTLALALSLLVCFTGWACNPTPEGTQTEEVRGGKEEPAPGLEENPALPKPERPDSATQP